MVVVVVDRVAGRTGTLGTAEKSEVGAGVVVAGAAGEGAADDAMAPPARSQGFGGEGIVAGSIARCGGWVQRLRGTKWKRDRSRGFKRRSPSKCRRLTIWDDLPLCPIQF